MVMAEAKIGFTVTKKAGVRQLNTSITSQAIYINYVRELYHICEHSNVLLPDANISFHSIHTIIDLGTDHDDKGYLSSR